MAQKKVKAHVSDEKKQVVKDFTKLIESYPIIAAVDVENLPAKQLMNMRTNLRG
ncbi:50S ribosomal protein L10, partial [Candidatus Woesearchaeota archaeon CG10_big_fil_rev_8_21_14_0_10_32_9]